ncbi:MAG TPA: 30S ribosome-binding factor RbfA [Patescibacteria group bacterium]|nr:30S ribosome-binding factor RbfA [Patescibacteria group bacterium]
MRKSGSGQSVIDDTSASRRLQKLESLLRSEVGAILERELELPPNTLLTITSVTVLPDLSQARLGVSILPVDRSQRIFKLLAAKAPNLQQLANRRLRLYRVPRLNFYLDSSLAEADHIDRLLDSLKSE